MKVQWLGHSCFLITSGKGVKVLTDPYQVGAYDAIHYGAITQEADIALVTHDHADHTTTLPGKPLIINAPGSREVKGIAIKGMATFHDPTQGSQRGKNIVFAFTVDGVRLAHLGDLGHFLSPDQLKELGAVDVLMCPVGGTYTVDAKEANQLVSQVKPRVVIPMHYKTPKCGLPITGVDDFLKGRERVQRKTSSEVEFTAGKLPAATETIVLQHAL